MPHRGPGEEKVGDVGTGDEQHERDGPHHREEHQLDLRGKHPLAERRDPRAPVFVFFRVCKRQARHGSAEVGLRLRHRDANLLLARASVRHREISIRSALGAGRWRIVRQLLTEAIGIGLLSAPLGILLAWVGVRMLDRAMPTDGVPYFIHWSLDARSLAYTIGISLLTGIAFGLAPALQAARANLQESLKEGGRGAAGGQRARLRNVLVVVEVALSLVLLAGASMFMHSFMNLQSASLGFDTRPLMTMRFFMPGVQYESPEAKAQRVEDIVRRVEALPGVQAVFASNFIPLGDGGGGGDVIVEGKPVEKGKEPSITLIATTPGVRQTMNIALVRGRDLTESEETSRTPVALVNQAMAKRFWGDEDPVGRRFRLTDERRPDWFTIVGTVADFRHDQPNSDEPVFPAAYVPYTFDATINTGLTIRVAGGPAQITAAVREDSRVRSRTAGVPGPHEGGTPATELLGGPPLRHHVLGIRRHCAGARRGRGLRDAFVLGFAAHAGDWCADGARGRPGRRFTPYRGARPEAGWHRGDPWDRRRNRGRDADPFRLVQRAAHGSCKSDRRWNVPDVHGGRGELLSGAPCDGRRSARRAEKRLKAPEGCLATSGLLLAASFTVTPHPSQDRNKRTGRR